MVGKFADDTRISDVVKRAKVNFLVILVLARGKCGLSNCTTRCLVAMATSDLLFLLVNVILWQLNNFYFPRNFLDITPVCSAVFVLIHVTTDCSVWFTVLFSFDRFVVICCQTLKRKYWTDKTLAVALAATGILLCSKNIPFYFRFQPGRIVNNVPWGCRTKAIYYTDPRWLGYNWFDNVLTPFIPFVLILLMNTLTVRYILVVSRVRKSLKGQSKGESHKDAEMESRRKSVITLLTISTSFILLWFVYVTNFLYFAINGTTFGVFAPIGYLVKDVSCSTNTLFYAVTLSKFRAKFRNAMHQLVT
ncbi:compound eye opsin BCRH2-like [Hemiscyllium ocellatum]|uniref:compound eye opsin BCRH2-like n=1 Tax=Hemiscyllium ocellatum TaxID=170820 RepID=UPI00296682E3|nr:compound eye opsin BCRH2-like [Hemiscyllium ocellatum]